MDQKMMKNKTNNGFNSFTVDFRIKLSSLKTANIGQIKPTNYNTVTSYFHIYNNIVFHKN